VIQGGTKIGKTIDERNLADAIYSFAANHKVRLTLQRLSAFPPRALPPKGSMKEFGESPLEKSIPFLLESAMRLG
jgi:hypothetical protein